ncbi:PH domain-containing protein [Roseiconus lacunae]|uniref:PH domain-containing protein n=1 Tax=Roseiconus lacunae TaxID=2605694 RepID=A0ABT7PBS6_9BACT|nr:PH domain-containing protein [Roseiconus lacunae]MDM4013948.1 PH domain-containing protein [Roseiconus lacunae]WRQ53244.1 PH domain-containing protein [Stieleria sp. HD01]
MPSETSSPSRRIVYPSAVDWWLAALLMLGPLICVGVTGMLLIEGKNQDAFISLVTGAGVLLLTGLLVIPCRYTITEDTLAIRCGIVMSRIPLSQIRTIEPSGSWLSAPALSVRRVKITTASRFYLVSPIDRERFISELADAAQLDQ